MRQILCIMAFATASAVAFAQSATTSATQDELTYFRYIFRTLASLDISQGFKEKFESGLVDRMSLNPQEVSELHSAVQTFSSELISTRAANASIMKNKSALSPADGIQLAALKAEQERMIQTLAVQLLNAVLCEGRSGDQRPSSFVRQKRAGRPTDEAPLGNRDSGSCREAPRRKFSVKLASVTGL